ncbi:uncharacterized protein LOC118414470 isoform X1 [Branchiostoma floridae]|uniref:Uncharacterized protein LOC118414470 isoform X1 n=2 Tax=Branchiostoma floridae TaxID=7739 RepID=A0A9J7MPN2_BRAFL|nr:uncharacterized protein LOC118414470 isoform X1 [Branchiostoma floridae]
MSTIPDHIQREADRATGEATGDHLYDVTFIYHDKDLDFVVQAVRYIEQQQGLRIYYRHRDSSGPILNNMVYSIQNSCITVAIISQNFLEDTLRDYELQLAILTAVKHGQGCLPILLDNCRIPATLETIETHKYCRSTEFKGLNSLVKVHLSNVRRRLELQRTMYTQGETAERTVADVHRQSCFPHPLSQRVDTQALKGMIIHEVWYLLFLIVFHIKMVTRGLPEGRYGTCNGLGWLHNGSRCVMSLLQSAYMCLQVACKTAMAPLHLVWAQVFRQPEDSSLMTYIGMHLYNSTNILVLILVFHIVWHNNYSLLSLNSTFLIVPFVKGHFCGQHTSAYRKKLKQMYECCKKIRKKKTRAELRRCLFSAKTSYTNVRNCIIASLGYELLQWAVLVYCTAKGVFDFTTLPTLNTFQLIVLFLHTCYLVAHLWLYYHDSTMYTLIEKNRFHYPELMEDSNFHIYHVELMNFVSWYYDKGQFK